MKTANNDEMTFLDAIQHAVGKALHHRATNVPVNDRRPFRIVRYDCDQPIHALQKFLSESFPFSLIPTVRGLDFGSRATPRDNR